MPQILQAEARSHLSSAFDAGCNLAKWSSLRTLHVDMQAGKLRTAYLDNAALCDRQCLHLWRLRHTFRHQVSLLAAEA